MGRSRTHRKAGWCDRFLLRTADGGQRTAANRGFSAVRCLPSAVVSLLFICETGLANGLLPSGRGALPQLRVEALADAGLQVIEVAGETPGHLALPDSQLHAKSHLGVRLEGHLGDLTNVLGQVLADLGLVGFFQAKSAVDDRRPLAGSESLGQGAALLLVERSEAVEEHLDGLLFEVGVGQIPQRATGHGDGFLDRTLRELTQKRLPLPLQGLAPLPFQVLDLRAGLPDELLPPLLGLVLGLGQLLLAGLFELVLEGSVLLRLFLRRFSRASSRRDEMRSSRSSIASRMGP